MPYLDLLRTVHLPVTSDGVLIKNSFGVVIAHTNNPFTAEAMAQLLNLAKPAAEAEAAKHYATEERKARMFARTIKGDQV